MDNYAPVRAIAGVICAASLASCATNQDRYLSMPEQQLCIDYMTYPSINIHQSAREEAIRVRRINCTPYVEAANAKIRSNQALDKQISDMRRTYTPTKRAPSARSGPMGILKGQYTSGMNKVCVYDQAGSDLAITVGAAELCPLSYP